MPTSLLFAVNNEGRVFCLSTNGTKWREFLYPGIEFKHISAVSNFLWAIGGDRQVYLHVHNLDTPIRVKEESYENQRWFPHTGFTNRLMPTDRYQFSSKDGLTERRKDKIRVPSMAWHWEGDWHIETMLNNQPLDQDGWTYAMDFPATFYNTKQWNSCVRRRKWARTRKYVAINSWCAIAPLYTDPTQEPFIDVCIGGQLMNGITPGSLQVWAVTIHGRVMYRKGVSVVCPEGTKWNEVPLPRGCEVCHVSCGATGLVWIVTSTGKTFIRMKINGGTSIGEIWEEVNTPESNSVKIKRISVGTNSVWAISSDFTVWFRKGINGENGSMDDSAKGTGWVEMIGKMNSITVAPNDQVFSIGYEDRCLYMRYGVTEGELTGKRWKLMQSTIQVSRASSTSSLNLMRQHRSHLCQKQDGYLDEDLETSRSAPTSLKGQPSWQKPIQPSSLPSSAQGCVEEPSVNNRMNTNEETTRKLTAWSPVRSVGSLLGLEANPEMDLNADWDGQALPEREAITCEPDWCQVDTMWSCIEAGALIHFDVARMPNWFTENTLNNALLFAPWRSDILESLIKQNISCNNRFKNYELAIEKTSCVKGIECRCILPNSEQLQYDECFIELEWVGSQSKEVESGTFSVLSAEKDVIKLQVSLSEILCVMTISEPGHPRLAMFILNFPSTEPLKLQFSSDAELDDWLAQLTSVSCRLQNVEGEPDTNSVWATTNLGDVFVYEPKMNLKPDQAKENIYFSGDLVYNITKSPWRQVLANGVYPETELTIIFNVPVNTDRFSVNFECGDSSNLALHFNPRFDDNTVVRNSKENSIWSEEERIGNLTIKPGDDCMINIKCEKEIFKIWVDNTALFTFVHRIKPDKISHISIEGIVELHRVLYKAKEPIIDYEEIFWRQMGGHLTKVENCLVGVTWGITADYTPWVYTGGWGGSFLSNLENSSYGINLMTDSYCFYVYENQRWNPLSGFSSRGLPTDRPMWSDSTGREKRSKETIRLLSVHWHWLTEWNVDFTTPGGVDSDGWQYAVDFSTSYHATKHIMDYVRRRRWARKCKLTITGPWQEVGNTKIADVSLQKSHGFDTICVWAVGVNGDVLYRNGVTKTNPMGDSWEHVTCDQSLKYVSCGFGNQVWVVAENGSTFWRFGITTSKQTGEFWENIETPNNVIAIIVEVAKGSVWLLDADNQLHVRHNVTPIFPEGTHWETIQNPSNIDGFKDISAVNNIVWAVTIDGRICKRLGITEENPGGVAWAFGIKGNWRSVCARGF